MHIRENTKCKTRVKHVCTKYYSGPL